MDTKKLSLCCEPASDVVIKHCDACGELYNAPQPNLSCPFCGSDFVGKASDQDYAHYLIKDERQALLKTLLTGNYFAA